MTEVEVAVGPIAFHAEGPVWWPGWGGLRYVDMLAGDVITVSANGSTRRTSVGSVAAALRPRAGGGCVVGVERGFLLLGDDDQVAPGGWPVEAFEDRTVRMNDGGCDPDGSFLCGSMAYDKRTGAGAVYRLDAAGGVQQVLGDVTVSNGLAWSPDGTRAYYVDSPTRRVDVFDWTSAAGLTDRRPLASLEDEEGGVPDGLTVDAEGCVWVAVNGSSVVHRYRPDGRLDGVVELPVTQVTACTFGGPDLDLLFMTTSREGLPEGEQPDAGSVYVCRPGPRGLLPLTFAG